MAGETVLIVEDNRENIVHLANNVLKPNGYKVITAMDGQRGLRSILRDRPDLVVLDLNMPKMDGLEVLAALKERQVDTPVILTTFYGSEQVAEQALHLGAVDYIVKPYEVADMLRAVEAALSTRPSMPTPAEAAEVEKRQKAEEAVETIPLTRQVERWMRDMNILTRIGKALMAQLDVRRICVRTVEAAIYIARSNHAFLMLIDEGPEAKLCLCATRGPDDREVRLIEEPLESKLALKVALSGETTIQVEAEDAEALAQVIGHAVGPAAATPLRWNQETFGVLLATRFPGEAGFSEADAEWLGGLAEYAAIAVHNARRFEQRGQALARPSFDAEGVTALQSDLEQLAAELKAASERIQHLATLLAADRQK
jgi:two-component system NtrC family sensor kinase